MIDAEKICDTIKKRIRDKYGKDMVLTGLDEKGREEREAIAAKANALEDVIKEFRQALREVI